MKSGPYVLYNRARVGTPNSGVKDKQGHSVEEDKHTMLLLGIKVEGKYVAYNLL
jgi:hypothetical protein